MAKVLIQTKGTEFEQNGKDMAIIDDANRAGIPIMLNSSDFNQAYAHADPEAQAEIHAGGPTEEVDPVFTASAAYGITSEDIESWNNKSNFSGNYEDLNGKPTIPSNTSDLNNDSGFISNESDPVFSASAAAEISPEDISNWNGKANPWDIPTIVNTEYSTCATDIAGEYNALDTYNLGDYVYHEGKLYRCSTAITVAEAWNLAHWTVIDDIMNELKDYVDSQITVISQRLSNI